MNLPQRLPRARHRLEQEHGLSGGDRDQGLGAPVAELAGPGRCVERVGVQRRGAGVVGAGVEPAEGLVVAGGGEDGGLGGGRGREEDGFDGGGVGARGDLLGEGRGG